MISLRASKSFRKEFRRQLKMAFVAAVGFTIAFAWRQSLFDMFQDFVARFFNISVGHPLTEIYTAFVITVFGVFVIYLSSRLFRE